MHYYHKYPEPFAKPLVVQYNNLGPRKSFHIHFKGWMFMPVRMNFSSFIKIFIGAAIFSFGLVHFNMQYNLAEGGFTGITLLLYFLFGWNPAVTNIILNIPVFIAGWKFFTRPTFIYTIFGTITVSLFLEIFQQYPLMIDLEEDLILASLLAGLFVGTGLGIIFRAGGTTGGSDIITRLLHHYAGWPMGRAMLAFDAIVITVSLLTYLTVRQAIYTLVAVFIASKIIDFIQEGAYEARGAFIVSDKYKEIGAKITKQMDRGVTIFQGMGFYSREEKKVLYCVVPKRQINELKNLIDEIDPEAFVSITYVHEVLGEGFTLDENKKPLIQ